MSNVNPCLPSSIDTADRKDKSVTIDFGESLNGEHVEEVLVRSLETNLHSSAGCILWLAKPLCQNLHHQHKRRPYSHDRVESNDFDRQALDILEEKSQGLLESLRDLVRSMGLSFKKEIKVDKAFRGSTVFTPRQDPKHEQEPEGEREALLSKAKAVSLQIDMVLPQEETICTTEEPLLKREKIDESKKSVLISSTSGPKSALARLAAQMKAKQRQECGDSFTPSLARPEADLNKISNPNLSVLGVENSSGLRFEPERSHTTELGRDSNASAKKTNDEVVTDKHLSTYERSFSAQTRLTSPECLKREQATQRSGVIMKHPSQMTREEFLSQYKRAPRRGEIGHNADQIARAEELGYVMSGSQSKASQMYVDRIQRQLHEREAARLHQQFREVEDKLMDDELIDSLLAIIHAHKKAELRQ